MLIGEVFIFRRIGTNRRVGKLVGQGVERSALKEMQNYLSNLAAASYSIIFLHCVIYKSVFLFT
jgi:hypothetical protein